MSWLVPRNELTPEQIRAVESSPEQHCLFLGSPGSGKTIVLLHRARHLIDHYGIPPNRCRLLIYTKALKAWIRAGLRDLRPVRRAETRSGESTLGAWIRAGLRVFRSLRRAGTGSRGSLLGDHLRAGLRDLDLPNDCVMTFDAWCGEHYRKRVSETLPQNGRSRDWNAIRQAVWEDSRRLAGPRRLLDFVMVDEGQDLDRRDFETLARVAKHVTVFMDPKQKIYEGGADVAGVKSALGPRLSMRVLPEAYRCSSHVVQVAASFVSGEAEREQWVGQNPPREAGERQLPLLCLAGSADDERANLIEVVRTRIDRSERIAILVPDNRLMRRYADWLREAGLEVEVKDGWREKPFRRQVSGAGIRTGTVRYRPKKKAALSALDFRTQAPKVMPYPSAKGLTFDTVLMPGLNREALKKRAPDLLERWLFVGITRATGWIYLSTTDGERALFLDRFRELERRKQLTIQGAARPAATETEDEDPEEDGDLSDLF